MNGFENRLNGRMILTGRPANIEMKDDLLKPNWASSGRGNSRPRGPTGFEGEVRRLGLSEQDYADSRELKRWCERNKDRHFIPELLLKRWGMSVDPD
jgi:hypothetical protein